MNDEQTPALRKAVENMATMRQAYDSLSQASEAYNVGKAQLAANITAKGVQASASETLPELAEKVSAISQESYTIDGGEMYAKQLFCSLESPNYWNLYEVLANLLSDGRLVQYGGILLAEYYRGYDSLALAGAGAGGAYVVSDKDENGQFIMYTNDTTHVWNTGFDGRLNRWVAYCFADEYHDFQITGTNTSPRSIFIGRNVGTITSLVNGRVSEIVVPNGSKLYSFESPKFTQNWSKKVVLNLVKPSNTIFYNLSGEKTEQIYLVSEEPIPFASVIRSTNGIYVINNIYIKQLSNGPCSVFIGEVSAAEITLEAEHFIYSSNNRSFLAESCRCKHLRLLGIEEWYGHLRASTGNDFITEKLSLFYKTNDKSRACIFTGYESSATDVELQNGWCKPLDISRPFPNLTEDNMYAHILQRLKQDEPDCGSGVTITLGSTNLAKLTRQESQDLLASLRGTYGYTFA